MKHAKPAHGLKRYLFLILLVVSCILIVPGCLIYENITEPSTDAPSGPVTTTTSTTVTTTVATTTTSVTTTATTTQSTNKVTAATTKAPSTSTGKVSFPDTLFIGDSRTHGLSMYGRITDATFFAKTSLTSYSALSSKVNISGLGEVTLETVLASRQFKTVYIMLGLNEIGNKVGSIAGKYQAIIDKIKATQPNAKIVLQSTLHVTSAWEKKKPTFKNSKINELNAKLQQMADGKTVFFLDINPVFDDENGALNSKYTGDGVHFYAKYYTMWRDYLAENRSLTVPTTTTTTTTTTTAATTATGTETSTTASATDTTTVNTTTKGA